MNQMVNEWTNQSMDEWVDWSVNKLVDHHWMNKLVNHGWMNESVDHWMNEMVEHQEIGDLRGGTHSLCLPNSRINISQIYYLSSLL